MNPQQIDKSIKILFKVLAIAVQIIFIIILILWYSDNKKIFFPQQEIKQIQNPLNPFK